MLLHQVRHHRTHHQLQMDTRCRRGTWLWEELLATLVGLVALLAVEEDSAAEMYSVQKPPV